MSLPINQIIQGDAIEIMRTWPAESVNCCVTSPPYWGLRDYGCDGQLGLEATPEEFVSKMVEVFAEVKRLLRDDGTLWLNLGDSYAGGGRGCGAENAKQGTNKGSLAEVVRSGRFKDISGIKAKDLVGIPWMVAFALRQDGWYLRQDIIWHKPNPMPEPVRDRCTKAHEYIFLLTKQQRYYYDQEAIREERAGDEDANGFRGGAYINNSTFLNNEGGSRQVVGNKKHRSPAGWETGKGSHGSVHRDGRETEISYNDIASGGRNKRSVWTVTTQPYKQAHFATFPPKLIEPCILAGCPKEVCNKCGTARTRITEAEQIRRRRKTEVTKPCDERSPSANAVAGVKKTTTGWTDCLCGAGFSPGVVLDPFMGSGTTAEVAYNNGRNYVGCELNAEYIKLDRGEKAKQALGLFHENNQKSSCDPVKAVGGSM